MIRIKRFKPTCYTGLAVHVCKDYKAQSPLIRGMSISACVICGQEAGTFYRKKDGRIEYRA